LSLLGTKYTTSPIGDISSFSTSSLTFYFLIK
jgi:hypothetical protein